VRRYGLRRCTNVHTIGRVDFEWDAAKSAANFAKHRIYFVDAGAVLEDDFALTMRDLNDEEERWITLGTDALRRVLVVVYTWRGQTIRIISARPATSRERRQYEEKR
jgi:uncharacterized protein